MLDQGIVKKPPVPGRTFRAVDLDGTLAIYDRSDKRTGRLFIGDPIPAMVERVKEWLARGDVVVIFTSRVADQSKPDHFDVLRLIHEWCERHIGERLYVTATKFPWIGAFYDDNAYHVIRNTGAVIPGASITP
jgi:hypothetical protein